MLPAFATVDDLELRLPQAISNVDRPRAQAALDDAASLIREAGGKDWVTDDDPPVLDDPPDILLTICCRAALRSFVNPEGVSQEAAGPFSRSIANASSDVYLTKNEVAQVRRAAGKVGLGTIQTTRGDLETRPVLCDGAGREGVADVYVDVEPAGQPLPFA